MFKKIILVAIAHAGLSLLAFVGLNAWAVGFLDGGGTDPGAAVGAIGIVVSYGLLQPAAHWLLTHGSVEWWTWTGLGVTAVIVSANSLVQVGLVFALLRAFRPRRPPGAG